MFAAGNLTLTHVHDREAATTPGETAQGLQGFEDEAEERAGVAAKPGCANGSGAALAGRARADDRSAKTEVWVLARTARGRRACACRHCGGVPHPVTRRPASRPRPTLASIAYPPRTINRYEENECRTPLGKTPTSSS
ncbi:hypothetical protein GCM10027445_10580 [Amycolatopsis endophytica]